MSNEPGEPKNRLSRFGPDFTRYAGLGMQYGITICILALGGYWLDQRLGTLPLLLILGLLLGFVGGTYSLIKKVPPPSGGSRRER